MKIVLVRHGRPDEGHAERPHDPPLADIAEVVGHPINQLVPVGAEFVGSHGTGR